MNILIFNCGSSSQGFAVYRQNRTGEGEIISSGKARNVATKTVSAPVLMWTFQGNSGEIETELSSHRQAAEKILALLDKQGIAIDAVGHRFVHGGSYFHDSTLLDNEALEKIRQCLPLAPIHNPNSYSVIVTCLEKLPGIPQYAVFDTAFHAQIPEENRVYGIPLDDAKANGWMKIGFHGLSYDYVSKRAAVLLGKRLDQLRLIMCHLGTGGSSVCAFREGHSIDISMGFSTFAGLVMSTRSGDLDPGIVLDMVQKGKTQGEITAYLTKKSGLIGLSGYSSNLGEIIEAAENGNKDCELAFKVYNNRLRHYIGAFLYGLNGADAIIFTDDAGVRYAKMRQEVCDNADFFGIKLDAVKNAAYDQISEACISATDSRVPIWVIPTDEERTIYNEIIRIQNSET